MQSQGEHAQVSGPGIETVTAIYPVCLTNSKFSRFMKKTTGLLHAEIEITGEQLLQAALKRWQTEDLEKEAATSSKQELLPKGWHGRCCSSCFANLCDFVTLTEEHNIVPEVKVSDLNGNTSVEWFQPITYQIVPPFPKRHLRATQEIQNTLNFRSEIASSGTPGCPTPADVYQGCAQQKALVFTSLVSGTDTAPRFGAGNGQCQKGTCPGAARAEMLSSAHKGNVALGWGTVKRRWRADRVPGEHLGLLSTIPHATPHRHPSCHLPSHWHWPLNPN